MAARGESEWYGTYRLVATRRVETLSGVSLFLVPKYIQNEQGEWHADNNVKAISLEKKMGMHGSPTAVIEYRQSQGWLVGKESAGLYAMFTMMNNARLGVGIEGLSQCE